MKVNCFGQRQRVRLAARKSCSRILAHMIYGWLDEARSNLRKKTYCNLAFNTICLMRVLDSGANARNRELFFQKRVKSCSNLYGAFRWKLSKNMLRSKYAYLSKDENSDGIRRKFESKVLSIGSTVRCANPAQSSGPSGKTARQSRRSWWTDRSWLSSDIFPTEL